jgi:hypothetical protein
VNGLGPDLHLSSGVGLEHPEGHGEVGGCKRGVAGVPLLRDLARTTDDLVDGDVARPADPVGRRQPEDAGGEPEVIVSAGSGQPDARDGLRLELSGRRRRDYSDRGGFSRRRCLRPPGDGGQDSAAAGDSEYERVQDRQAGGNG